MRFCVRRKITGNVLVKIEGSFVYFVFHYLQCVSLFIYKTFLKIVVLFKDDFIMLIYKDHKQKVSQWCTGPF